MSEHIQRLLADGSLFAWPVAFIAGLLSVATPCVLPMLPITLGALGVTKAGSRRRALSLSSAYVAGIVVCFTTLGVISALTGTLFGSMLGHPAVAAGIALFMIALAGASFELYEVGLPSSLTTKLVTAGGVGHPGAFAMGLVAGFIAVPCIGPVLLGILAYVGSRANVAMGAGILAVYALGFGLPFMLVGALALKLPKRGPWMRAVKSLFGVALLVTAFWFLRGAFSPLRQFASAWIGWTLVGAGLIVGALHLQFDSGPVHRARKTVGIVLMVAGAAFALNALLAPRLAGWCREDGSGKCIASACAGHALTVIDFGAEWCSGCHEMDNTFEDPRVRIRLEHAGLVKVDIDHASDLTERYGVSGVPTVVFLDGQCKEIGRSVGFVAPDAFLRKLP